MTRTASLTLAALAVAWLAAAASTPALAADPPADRVVVMYFHRTNRCDTCKKMGSYAEEAVKAGFAQQIKDGTVEFHFINFEDEKNAALTKGYRVSGPALIVAKVTDNKVAKHSNLKDIWDKVNNKAAFLKYVRDNVSASLK
jgi:hypothetical protein